jgi:hypothetical protein
MQQLVILHPELDARTNLTQLLQEGVAPADHVPVILPPETEDAWNLLTELRVIKNEVFFAGLTEKAVELFQ